MPLFTVRYGLPLGIFLLGVVFLVIEPNSTGFDGFCTATGAALALLLLNALFRAGVAGDRDRDREEAAREYYDRHGHWPDEAPPGRPELRGPAVPPAGPPVERPRREPGRLKRPSPSRRPR